MRCASRWTYFAVAAVVALGSNAHGQTPAPGQGPGAATFVRPAGTFASPAPYRGQAMASQASQAVHQQAAIAPARRPIRPFNNVMPGPSVSPYLALDVRDGDSGLSAYHMFVKPQLDQQQFNAIQQAQYQRLQGQVRSATTASANVAPGPGAGISIGDHRSRFMNYGGYFPTAR